MIKLALLALATNIHELQSCSYAERDQLPRKPGIYFLSIDGLIRYIGDTANLFVRWQGHSLLLKQSSEYKHEIRSRGTIHFLVHESIGDRQDLEHMFMLLYCPELNAKDRRIACSGIKGQQRTLALKLALALILGERMARHKKTKPEPEPRMAKRNQKPGPKSKKGSL